jgi:hypothetical protein
MTETRTREQIVAELMVEDDRLQYDGKDSERIADAAKKVTVSFVHLIETAGAFRDEAESKADEDSADRMKQVRQQLAYAYADSLIQLHKFGATFRFSGEAFDRLVEASKGPEEAPCSMAGL